MPAKQRTVNDVIVRITLAHDSIWHTCATYLDNDYVVDDIRAHFNELKEDVRKIMEDGE